jgi:plastocyanin
MLALLAALALGLTAAACGDDDDSDSSSDTTAADDGGGSGDAAELVVQSNDYSDVSAPAGGQLDVVNTSGAAHTFTADDGEFDEEVPDGDTVAVDVPEAPGEYAFHCEIHPSMQATLTAE